MADDSDVYSKTWTDFTKRMKGSKVTQENWKLFYDKYKGFIVCYVSNHSTFNEQQIQDVMDQVVDAIFVKHALDKFETREGQTFRSWFATLIQHKIEDKYRSLKKKRKLEFVGEEQINGDNEPRNEAEVYNTKEEEALWRSYIAYLVLDEVSKKSPARQTQCFLWRVYHKKETAQIAVALNMEPEQVSEEVRAFKDKLITAARRLGEQWDMDTTDWKGLIQEADAAKAKYLKIADNFSRRVMQK